MARRPLMIHHTKRHAPLLPKMPAEWDIVIMGKKNKKPAASCTRQQTVHAATGVPQPLLRDKLWLLLQIVVARRASLLANQRHLATRPVPTSIAHVELEN